MYKAIVLTRESVYKYCIAGVPLFFLQYPITILPRLVFQLAVFADFAMDNVKHDSRRRKSLLPFPYKRSHLLVCNLTWRKKKKNILFYMCILSTKQLRWISAITSDDFRKPVFDSSTITIIENHWESLGRLDLRNESFEILEILENLKNRLKKIRNLEKGVW